MPRRGAFSKLVFVQGQLEVFWPALCLALWMFGYQTAATVCLYIAPFAIGGIPNVVVGSGARVPAEAPLQQQVAIRHSTSPYYSRSSHSGLSLDLCAVLAGVFVTFLLFAFECGPMSMEWSGPMEGVEWSAGAEAAAAAALAHGCRGSQAALSSPIQVNSAQLTMCSLGQFAF